MYIRTLAMLAVATVSSVQKTANASIFGYPNGTQELHRILAPRIGAQSIPVWRGSFHYSCKASSSDENGASEVFTASISEKSLREQFSNGISLLFLH